MISPHPRLGAWSAMSADGSDHVTLEEDGTLRDGEWKDRRHRYRIGRISSSGVAARGTGRWGARRRRGGESEAPRHALIKGFITSSVMCQDDNQSSR